MLPILDAALAAIAVAAVIVFAAIRVFNDLSPLRRLERLSALDVTGLQQADVDRLDRHRRELLERVVTGGIAGGLNPRARLLVFSIAALVIVLLSTIGTALALHGYVGWALALVTIAILLALAVLALTYLNPTRPPSAPRAPKPPRQRPQRGQPAQPYGQTGPQQPYAATGPQQSYGQTGPVQPQDETQDFGGLFDDPDAATPTRTLPVSQPGQPGRQQTGPQPNGRQGTGPVPRTGGDGTRIAPPN